MTFRNVAAGLLPLLVPFLAYGGPQSSKQGTLPTLQAAKTQFPALASKLQQAMDRIGESLLDNRDRPDCDTSQGDDPEDGRSLFLAEDILDPERGSRTFNRERSAADVLEDLLKDRKTPAAAKPVLQGVLNALVSADQGIAAKAITDARAFLGGQANTLLRDADSRFVQANALAQQGKASQAISKYGESWSAAQEFAAPQAALKYVRDLSTLLRQANRRIDRSSGSDREKRLKALAAYVSRRSTEIEAIRDRRISTLASRLRLPVAQVRAQVVATIRLVGGADLEACLLSTISRLAALQSTSPQTRTALQAAVTALRHTAIPSDRTPPVITGLQPANGAFLAHARPVLSAAYSDALSGIDTASVVLLLDGQNRTAQVAVTASGISFSPATDLAEGTHTVSLTVKDKSGNAASAQASWTVDVTRPLIVVAEPADGALVMTATPTMRVTFADLLSGVDLSSLVLMLDGMDITSRFLRSAGEATYTPAMPDALSNAQHTLTARILDRAGNEQAAQSLFTVQTAQPDTTPPTASIVFPRRDSFGDPTAFEGSAWRVVADARDPGPSASGILKVEFFSDGVKFAEATSAPYETTITFPGGSAGQIRALTVLATDNAGNSTTSQAVSVQLVSRPATGAISFRASGGPATTQAGQPFPSPITIEAIDAQGNVDPAYEGFVFFFTSDPASSLNNFVFTQFTPDDRGVIQVDFGILLSGQPPLLTAGRQVIAMADFSNPARDQGVISVQVQAGPPALVKLSSASTDQLFNDGEIPANPMEASVTDAFGNPIPGVQVRLEIFEEGVLVATQTAETASPATFRLPRITAGTTRYEFRLSTPTNPSLPPLQVKRFIDTFARIEGMPEVVTAGQDITLTYSLFDRNGVLVPDAQFIVSSPVEFSEVNGMIPPFKGPNTIDAPTGTFTQTGFLARANTIFQTIQLQIPGGPTVAAQTFVQSDVPVLPSFSNLGFVGGAGIVSDFIFDRFGNLTQNEPFRIDLVSSAGTQSYYTFTREGALGTLVFTLPSALTYRGLAVTATITSVRTGASISGPVNVNPGQPDVTQSVQILGPEAVGMAGDTVTLPPFQVSFRFDLGPIPIQVNQEARFTGDWEPPPEILGSPVVTDLDGNPLAYTISGNVITLSGSTRAFRISGLTVRTTALSDSGMGSTVYVRASDFLSHLVLARIVTPGLRLMHVTENILHFVGFGDRLNPEEQTRVVAAEDPARSTLVAIATGSPQALGDRFEATLESLRPEGGPVEGGYLPSQTQVQMLRISDSQYMSPPIRALEAGQFLPRSGIGTGNPRDFQTVAVEPGGSLVLTKDGLGSTVSQVAGFQGTLQVTLEAGQDPVPGESGPRPLDLSIFRDTTPTIRLTPSIPGFSASQTSPGVFLLTSQGNNLQSILSVSVVDESTNRTFTKQMDGNDILLEVGGASNPTPLSVGALGLRLSGRLEFLTGPSRDFALNAVPFMQRIRFIPYTKNQLDPLTGEVVVAGGWVQEVYDALDKVHRLFATNEEGVEEDQWVLERRLRLLFRTDDPATPGDEGVTDRAISDFLRAERMAPMGLDRTQGLVSVRAQRELRGMDLIAARDNPPGQPEVERAVLVSSIEFVRPRVDSQNRVIRNPSNQDVVDPLHRFVPMDVELASRVLRNDQGQETDIVSYQNPYALSLRLQAALDSGSIDTVDATLIQHSDGATRTATLTETGQDTNSFVGGGVDFQVQVLFFTEGFSLEQPDGIVALLQSTVFGKPFGDIKYLNETAANSLDFRESRITAAITAPMGLSPATLDTITVQLTPLHGNPVLAALAETGFNTDFFTGQGIEVQLFPYSSGEIATETAVLDSFMAVVSAPALGIQENPVVLFETTVNSLVFQNTLPPDVATVGGGAGPRDLPSVADLERNVRELQQYRIRTVSPDGSLASIILRSVDVEGNVKATKILSTRSIGSAYLETSKPLLAVSSEPDDAVKQRFQSEFDFILDDNQEAEKGGEKRKEEQLTFVALGDSVTAGMHSLSTQKLFQEKAYPQRIAGLVFGMPMAFREYLGRGKPPSLWDIQNKQLRVPVSGWAAFVFSQKAAFPDNLDKFPLQNLAVPGIEIRHIMEADADIPDPSPVVIPILGQVPDYIAILADEIWRQGAQVHPQRGNMSALQQAGRQGPKLAIVFLGNNDAQEAMNEGQSGPAFLTPVNGTFVDHGGQPGQQKPGFRASLESILGGLHPPLEQRVPPDIIVCKLPHIADSPHFMPVGVPFGKLDNNPGSPNHIPFSVVLTEGGGLFVKATEIEFSDSFKASTVLVDANNPAGSRASLRKVLRNMDREVDRARQTPGGLAGFNAAKSPLTISLPPTEVVSPAEETGIRDATNAYNSVIQDVVDTLNDRIAQENQQFPRRPSRNPILIVDIGAFFQRFDPRNPVDQRTFVGKPFSAFWDGGLFSLDGFHPSVSGQALIADLIMARVREAIQGQGQLGQLPRETEEYGGLPFKAWLDRTSDQRRDDLLREAFANDPQ